MGDEPRAPWMGAVGTVLAAAIGGAAIELALFDEAEHLPERFKPCASAPPMNGETRLPFALAFVGVLAASMLVRVARRRKTSGGAAAVGVAGGLAAAASSALAQGLVYHWKAKGTGVFVALAIAFVAFGAAYGTLAFLVARTARAAPNDARGVLFAAGAWSTLVGAATVYFAGDIAALVACAASVAVGAAMMALAGRMTALGASLHLAAVAAVLGLGLQASRARYPAVVVVPFRITSLAADEARLYFADEQSERLFSVDKSGGKPVLLAATPGRTSSFAFDATNVFWATKSGEVLKLSRAGGEPEIIFRHAGLLGNIEIDGDQLYAIHPIGEDEGELLRVTTDGGAETRLGPVFGCLKLLVDEPFVYEYGGECPALFRVAKRGGTPEPMLPSADSMLSSMTHDAASLYFAEWHEDRGAEVIKMAKNGGAVVVLAKDLARPRSLVLDHTNLYWTENGFKPTVNGETCWTARVVEMREDVPRVIDYGEPAGPLVVDEAYVYWVSWDEGGGRSSIRRANKED